ncbi:MAG: hypothetical protein L6R36_006208 [Xanthoria steineri]|nr:MAG: hypothetical protein L6R36_006208 [Xanthoria steineri]
MELGGLLDVAKPRVVTLEQTAGLMRLGYRGGRHSKSFDQFISQFTSSGYNIALKILDMAEFGLPQRRERLIMIASRPGEPRLNFPEPTHAKYLKNTGLLPFTSVNAAISKIPPGHRNHELPPEFKVPRKEYDGNAPLRNIVMTAGTMDTHPSGLRPFSLRELACLQGFPLDHRFSALANRTSESKSETRSRRPWLRCYSNQ